MDHKYEDIIHLPHHVSKKHPPMPLGERAAQFSPFAALTGYKAVLNEAARPTCAKPNLTEAQKAALDQKLQAACKAPRPEVAVTYFLPDTKKAGGSLQTAAGRIYKTDISRRQIVLEDGTYIPVDSVTDIEFL